MRSAVTIRRNVWAFTAVCALLSADAFAQTDADKAMARQLAVDGQEALDKGDAKTAEQRFAQADKLFHAPTLLLGLARAHKAQKKYFSAQAAYLKIISEGASPSSPPAFQRAVDDAKKEVEEVSGKVGNLVVSVKGNVEGLSVTVDGEKISVAALGLKRPIDPGEHAVKATAPGYKEKNEKVRVEEGASQSVELSLEKDPNYVPPAVPSEAKPIDPKVDPRFITDAKPVETRANHLGSYIAWGVGGAGLILGVTTGIVAMGKKSSIEKACGGNTCPASEQSNIDSYKTMGTLSTIGFIVAGVGGAAGAVLWFTAPQEEVKVSRRITPYVLPGSVGLSGNF